MYQRDMKMKKYLKDSLDFNQINKESKEAVGKIYKEDRPLQTIYRSKSTIEISSSEPKLKSIENFIPQSDIVKIKVKKFGSNCKIRKSKVEQMVNERSKTSMNKRSVRLPKLII